jgi:leader peptidase (prepilin peptidase) / N-methyltransferase
MEYFKAMSIEILLAFLFGTMIGSFLNVLIWRLPREETMEGRSQCPHCRHHLVWHDLVPVFSILFQRGKCKYCHKPISLRYPLIEVLTGIIFAVALWLFPVSDLATGIMLAKIFCVVAICIVVFVVDLEHYLILNKVVYPGIVLMAVFALLLHGILPALFGAAIAFIPFWLLWFASRGKWMGFGDVKFAAFMGLALGVKGVIVALFLSFVIGAIVGVGLILISKKQLGSRIPFGTFLSAATIVAILWGNELANLYWQLILGS